MAVKLKHISPEPLVRDMMMHLSQYLNLMHARNIQNSNEDKQTIPIEVNVGHARYSLLSYQFTFIIVQENTPIAPGAHAGTAGLITTKDTSASVSEEWLASL